MVELQFIDFIVKIVKHNQKHIENKSKENVRNNVKLKNRNFIGILKRFN